MNLDMKKLLIIVGTRPNFIKVTQFKRIAAERPDVEVKIVHTGQHYDEKMSDIFFQQFGLVPDFFLNIPQASANTQMAEIMLRLEKVINEEYRPDIMMVAGDVNSTFASALTANKMGIKIAHLESGLRSEDRGMPEEINRVLTDEITDYFFITEQSGIDNLTAEGKRGVQHLVGNTMIDTMVAFEENIQASSIVDELKLEKGEFVLMTIHRPATVDFEEELVKLQSLIEALTKHHKVVFPIHPRTVNSLKKFGMYEAFVNCEGLVITPPMDYFAFQRLVADCKLILTDSGGIQEESTFRQVPCLTLRPNTERPITITLGTNELITFDQELILDRLDKITNGTYKTGEVPPLWDGKATERVLEIIANLDVTK
jgi:UDP-N-acetylglucosamine 2-epimerase (non-hydrolysing)